MWKQGLAGLGLVLCLIGLTDILFFQSALRYGWAPAGLGLVLASVAAASQREESS